jgi:hypothetical protein
MAMAKLRIN